MTIERKLKSTNLFRPRLFPTLVTIEKKAYTAELVEYSGRNFTVVALEPENKEDKQAIAAVSDDR